MADKTMPSNYWELLLKEQEKNKPKPIKVSPTTSRFNIPRPGETAPGPESQGALYDFLWEGLGKGFASGLTWGATELSDDLTGGEQGTGLSTLKWEDMSDSAKAGYILGEGASLFIPVVGPFAAMGKGLRALQSLSKFGARGGTKLAGKAAERVTKEVAEGAFKGQLETIAKQQGKTINQVVDGLGATTRKAIVDSASDGKSMEYLYKHALKGEVADQANEVIYRSTQASIAKAFKEQGIKISNASQVNQIADVFTKGLKENIRAHDLAEDIAMRVGGADPGKFSKWLGMGVQDAVMMTTHGLVQGKMKELAKGDHFDTNETLMHSFLMAAAFPVIRGVPNIIGDAGGSENLKRGFKYVKDSFLKTNYRAIATEHGDDSVRGLLKMAANGGKLDLYSSSKFGQAWWKTSDGTTYEGLANMTGKIDDMPMEHVFELLNKFKQTAAKEAGKKWSMNYAIDLIQSAPRMALGIGAMNFEPIMQGAFQNMSDEEFYSHMFMSALMTKNRGAWGKDKATAHMVDYAPYEKVINSLGYKAKDIPGIVNMYNMENYIGVGQGKALSGTKEGRRIFEIFEEGLGYDGTLADNAPKYNKSEHKKVIELYDLYAAMKQEGLGIYGEYSYNPDALKKLPGDVLTKMVEKLNTIEFADKTTVGDMSLHQVAGRLTKKSADDTALDFIEVFRELKEIGLPVISTDGGKLVAAAVRSDANKSTDNMHIFNQYNKVAKLLADKGYGEFYDKFNNEVAKERDFTVEQIAAAEIAMESGIKRLNNRFNMRGLAQTFDNNFYLRHIEAGAEASALDRLTSMFLGRGTTQDAEILGTAKKVLSLDGLGNGYVNVDKLKFDYEGLAKELGKSPDELRKTINEKSLREDLGAIIELLRVQSPPVRDNLPSEKTVSPEEVRQVVESINEIKNVLPKNLRDNFTTEGVNYITKEILQARGMNASVVPAVQEMLLTGIGYVKNGKIETPNPEAIRNKIAADLGLKDASTVKERERIGIEVENAVKQVQELHNAIGVKHLRFKDWIVEGEYNKDTYKDFTSEDIFRTWENLKTTEVAHFVNNADKIIKTLKESPGLYNVSFETVKELQAKIQHNPTAIDRDQTVASLDRIINQIASTSRTMDKNPYAKDIEKIQKLSNSLRKKINSMPKDEQFDYKGDEIETMHGILNNIITKETAVMDKLARITKEITQDITDGSYSKETQRQLTDKLSREFKELLGWKVEEGTTIQELVDATHESMPWAKAENIVKSIELVAKAKLMQNDVIRPESDKRGIENLENDKRIHTQNETPLTISRRFGLVEPTNPNEINSKLVELVADHKSGHKRSNDPVFDFVHQAHAIIRASNNIGGADRRRMLTEFTESSPEALKLYGSLIRQRTIKQGRVVIDKNGHTVLMVDVKKAHRDNAQDIWFNSKGYDIVHLNQDVWQASPFTGRYKVKSIKDILENVNSTRALQEKLRDASSAPINEAEIIKNIAEGAGISNKELKDMQTAIESLESPVAMRISPKLSIVFNRTKDNIRNLDTNFNSFYDNVSNYLKGRGDYQYKHSDGRTRNVSGDRLNQAFKTLFGDIKRTGAADNVPSEIELKLLSTHSWDAQRGKFMDFLAAIASGETTPALKKLQGKMFKNGYVADGGTTMMPHIDVVKSLTGHPDQQVREIARKIVRDKGEVRYVGIKDEAANVGTSILKRSREFHLARSQKEGGIAKFAHEELLSELNKEKGGKYSSTDNSLVDGGIAISRRFAKLLWALQGHDVANFSGQKPVIFEFGEMGMLGKGFFYFSDRIVGNTPAGVDMVIPGSAAKNAGPSIEFVNVGKGKNWWESSSMQNASGNQIGKLNIENIGLGFRAKEVKGVTISNSEFRFEPQWYLERGMSSEFADLNETYSRLQKEFRNVQHTKNELLSYLYELKKDEGLVYDQGDLGLVRNLVEYGVDAKNPIVTSTMNRLLRNKAYQIIRQKVTKFGSDMIIRPNIDSDLNMPSFVEFGFADGTEVAKSHRANLTFGEVAPYRGMLSTRTDNLRGINFAARYEGIDFLIGFNQHGKFKVESPAIERMAAENNQLLNNKGEFADQSLVLKKYRTKEVYKEVTKKYKKYLENLQDQVNRGNLNGEEIFELITNGSVRSGKTQDFIKLKSPMKDKNELMMAMSGNAIPLKGKDKGVHKIKRLIDDQGFVEINHFDERVMHQRDNDGDHFYGKWKKPFSMMAWDAKGMGFVRDFPMMKKEAPEINIFGIDYTSADKVAGRTSDSGYSTYADKLESQAMAIGTTIGEGEVITLLSKLGLGGRVPKRADFDTGREKRGVELYGEKFDSFDSYQDYAARAIERVLPIFQNAVDKFGGEAPLMLDKYLKNYLRYGDIPANIDRTKLVWEDGSLIDLPTEGLYGNLGRKGNTYWQLERDMVDIMVRTLKKSNMISNDVYDDAGSRPPEPYEIQKAYGNLKAFYSDPRSYIVKELARQYSYDKSNEKLNQILEYFYQPDIRGVDSVEKMNKFIENMVKYNKLPANFDNTTSQGQILFGNYEKITGWRSSNKMTRDKAQSQFEEMMRLSPGTRDIYEVVNKEIFKEPEYFGDMNFKDFDRVGLHISDAISRMQFLKTSGKTTQNLIDEGFAFGQDTFDINTKNAFNSKYSQNRGVYRDALLSVRRRIMNELENFSHKPGRENQIDRRQHDLDQVENLLRIFDGQVAKQMVKEVNNNNFIEVKINKDKASSFYSKPRSKNDVYVYKYKGDKNLFKKGDIDFGALEHVGFVKSDKTYKKEQGFTYIEVKNPVVEMKVHPDILAYTDALHQIGNTSRVENVFSESATESRFRSDVTTLERELSWDYRNTIREAKTAQPARGRLWAEVAAKESVKLNEFYKKWTEEVMDSAGYTREQAMQFLTEYLITPQPLNNRYISNKVNGQTIDMPYFKVNERLVKATYSWLQKNGAGKIVKDIVQRQQAIVDGKDTQGDVYKNSLKNSFVSGYDWKSLGSMADPVISLMGRGGPFHTPAIDYLIATRGGVKYNKRMEIETPDGHKILVRVPGKDRKPDNGCIK